MSAHVAPVLFVVTLWWFSTGAVLWLARGRGAQVHGRLLGMTVLAAGGFAVAAASANSTAGWAPYAGFLAALTIWGWVEYTFLTGLITGPRTSVCPVGITERQRFHLAFRTVSRHELALLVAFAGVALITWGGTDLTCLLTFATLWVMRVSAKLTIFSGVPAMSQDMMPPRIAHMQSYFRNDRIGPVFWFATALSTVGLGVAVVWLATGGVPAAHYTTAVIVTTLLALAALEHWVMIAPIRETALWQWAMTNTSDSLAPSNSMRTDTRLAGPKLDEMYR